MLFLGDLACPDEKIERLSDCINNMTVFKDEIIVVNFEGNIVDNPDDRRPFTLYNLSRAADLFQQSEAVIASLANNHMYDYPAKILETKRLLESNGIGTFGLYEKDKILPYEFTDKKRKRFATPKMMLESWIAIMMNSCLRFLSTFLHIQELLFTALCTGILIWKYYRSQCIVRLQKS